MNKTLFALMCFGLCVVPFAVADLGITILPTNQTIDAGSTIVFTNTTGGGDIPYAWLYTVNSMTGVTVLNNSIRFNSAGSFNVSETVTDNSLTMVTSDNSTITVLVAPTISILPVSNTIYAGGHVHFTNTTANGYIPYVWQYIVSPTNPSVNISGNMITFGTVGVYNVTELATDDLSVVAVSNNATINVIPTTTTTILPTNRAKIVVYNIIDDAANAFFTFVGAMVMVAVYIMYKKSTKR